MPWIWKGKGQCEIWFVSPYQVLQTEIQAGELILVQSLTLAGFCQFRQDPICRLWMGFKEEDVTLLLTRIWQGISLMFILFFLGSRRIPESCQLWEVPTQGPSFGDRCRDRCPLGHELGGLLFTVSYRQFRPRITRAGYSNKGGWRGAGGGMSGLGSFCFRYLLYLQFLISLCNKSSSEAT